MASPLNFPNPPLTVGQQFLAGNGITYAWDGATWTTASTVAAGGPAGGDLSGTYPNPHIAAGVIVDADVSATAAIQYTKLSGVPTALPPSGAAGGSLAGTYPNPTIAPLAVTNAAVNDVAWGKVTGAPAAFPPSGTASGDLQGTYPAPTINPTAPALLWSTSTGLPITPMDTTKDVTIHGLSITGVSGPNLGWITLGTAAAPVAKGRVFSGAIGVAGAQMGMSVNRLLGGGGAVDDLSRAGWQLYIDGQLDRTSIARNPAGNTTLTDLCWIDGPTGHLALGTLTAKLRLVPHTTASAVGYLAENAALNAAGTAWAQDDATKASMVITLNPSADTAGFYRMVAGGAGGFIPWMILDGPTGNLATGTQTAKLRLVPHPTTSAIGYLVENGSLNAAATAWVQDDAAKSTWGLVFNCAADMAVFQRAAPGVTTFSTIGSLDASGNLTITGTHGYKPSGSTWEVTPSDIRFKQDIAPYTASLTELCALAPIRYRLKSNPDGPLCYGFDAAKVREVFPECVHTRRVKLDPDDAEETDVLALDMHPILVALINAIKELAARKH